MLRIFIFALSINFIGIAFSQDELSTIKPQQLPEMKVERNFGNKYARQLDLLIRTYPMALKAKELIEDYEKDLAKLDKKRKKKKYSKQAHDKLKDEFVYNIRDLYTSEGAILTKLVHRETGMTVNQIINKYRGSFQTSVYTGMAKMWGHDLNAKYNASGDDWITEIVIQDILNENIDFDTEMRKINKTQYKKGMKEYRDGLKRSRKQSRTRKKENRKQKRG